MKRPVIVLASVLKPVTDTRMYEKLGISLGQTNKYEINIIGIRSKFPTNIPGISFFPMGPYGRFSIARALAPWKIAWHCFRKRPALLVITTHELLLAAVCCKLILRTRLIYDLQENYALNLSTQGIYPWPVAQVLARWVRWKERLTVRWIDHYFLAESAYLEQLPFIRHKNLVLPNLARQPDRAAIRPAGPAGKRLLFTGTIAAHTGILDAIRLADALHQADPEYSLHIEGYCATANLRARLTAEIAKRPYITGQGLEVLSDHDTILREINRSGIGLLPYHDHPSTRELVPTKFYEYLAVHLPMIIPLRENLIRLSRPYPAAIAIDFDQPDGARLAKELSNTTFYQHPPGSEVWWESVAPVLVACVEKMTR